MKIDERYNMLVISSGYCVEAHEDGTWSTAEHELLANHKKLHPELLPPAENHSAQEAVIYKVIGYSALQE